MNRVLGAARIQLAAWPSTLGIPWLVLALSFVINITIFALVSAPQGSDNATGGLLALYIFVFVAYVLTMTQYFPMTLALSVTRRTFYLATSLVAVTQSLAYAVVVYALKLVENATGGWGVSLSFFSLGFMSPGNGVLQILVYAIPMLMMAFLGIFCGVTFKRWGIPGMFTLVIAALVVFGGLAVLVTWLRQWRAIGAWFVDQSPVSLFAGWPALITVALAAVSLFMIRRATP